jgi:hypothetical protein
MAFTIDGTKMCWFFLILFLRKITPFKSILLEKICSY